MNKYICRYLPAPDYHNEASLLILFLPSGTWSVGTVGSGYASEDTLNKELFALYCTDPVSGTWRLDWNSDKSKSQLRELQASMEAGDIFVRVSVDGSEEYEYEIEKVETLHNLVLNSVTVSFRKTGEADKESTLLFLSSAPGFKTTDAENVFKYLSPRILNEDHLDLTEVSRYSISLVSGFNNAEEIPPLGLPFLDLSAL